VSRLPERHTPMHVTEWIVQSRTLMDPDHDKLGLLQMALQHPRERAELTGRPQAPTPGKTSNR